MAKPVDINLTGFNAEYKINDKKLKILIPIIEEWLKILRSYVEKYQYRDAMYSYNERATISSLAGAVWRCGGYAQEEYIATKMKEGKEHNGRIDLFFEFAHKQVIIEAKQKRLDLKENNQKNIEKHILSSLNDAINDTRKTKKSNDYGDFNIAISFFTPTWKKGSKQKKNIKAIKKSLENIDNSMYVFFESKKDIEYDGYIYNICVAICKIV